MAFYHFLWTDEIVDHIDQHGISQEDFEHVVCNPVSQETSHSSGLLAAFGYASDGSYIIAIYEIFDDTTILPVTAYEVEEPL